MVYVKNHPFIDGDKRVGLAATLAFLGLNGLWLEADPDATADLVVAGKAEMAVFVKAHLQSA